jgi:Metallo-peptidase family M12B Reprolysin-like/Secretion system C-terminal sorting domain
MREHGWACSNFRRHHASRITHHASRITHHASRITHHASHASHASRITHHASRITHHASRITHHALLILCLFISFRADAQNPNRFFTETQEVDAQLNANQKKLLTTVQRGKYTKNTTVVKVNKLRESLTKDVLTIPIAGKDVLFESDRFEYFAKDDYVWSGKLKTNNGNMLLVSKPEGVMGAIQYDDKFFFLQPIKNNFCLLVEQDVSSYEKMECLSEKNQIITRSISTLINNGCDLQDGTSCSATIDILVLISTGAQTWINNNLDAFGQALFIPIMQASINTSFQNSGIPNKQVRVRVASSNFSVSTNILNDRNDLIVNSSVSSLRNQYKADIVVGLTNQSYAGYAGVAGTLSVNSDSAYALVEISQAITGRWTFAHEFAHILGARHNRGTANGNDNSSVCGHGFEFNDGGVTRRTIMALNPVGQQRILNFSNPNINFNGLPTGSNTVGAEADNARMIRNTGCIASAFRPSPELSAFMSSSGDVCTGMLASAIVTPPAPGITVGQGPYQFDWFLTTSAYFDPSNLIGTGQTITVNDQGLTIFWIHVRITAVDGTTLVISRRFTSYCNYLIGSTTNTLKKGNSFLNVSPNPSNSIFQAEVDILDEIGSTKIEVLDINGKLVKIIKNQILPKGVYLYKIDLSDVANGLYLLKLQNIQQNNIIKLIKN